MKSMEDKLAMGIAVLTRYRYKFSNFVNTMV